MRTSGYSSFPKMFNVTISCWRICDRFLFLVLFFCFFFRATDYFVAFLSRMPNNKLFFWLEVRVCLFELHIFGGLSFDFCIFLHDINKVSLLKLLLKLASGSSENRYGPEQKEDFLKIWKERYWNKLLCGIKKIQMFSAVNIFLYPCCSYCLHL